MSVWPLPTASKTRTHMPCTPEHSPTYVCQSNALNMGEIDSSFPGSPELPLYKCVNIDYLLQHVSKRQCPWIKWNRKWKLWISDIIHGLSVKTRVQNFKVTELFTNVQPGKWTISVFLVHRWLVRQWGQKTQPLVPTLHTLSVWQAEYFDLGVASDTTLLSFLYSTISPKAGHKTWPPLLQGYHSSLQR